MDTVKKYFGSEESIFPFITTSILCFILIVNYLLFMFFYPYNLLEQSPEMLTIWGQDNNKVLNGEIYRIFTAIWIHGNIIHLASNLLFLFIFGERLEELTNGRTVLLVFIISGIVGNIGTFLLLIFDLNFISFGSSGSIFGLLGAIYYKMRGRSRYEQRKSLYLLIIFFFITIGQDTNIFSHFFGLIGGISTMVVKIQFSRIKKNRNIRFYS